MTVTVVTGWAPWGWDLYGQQFAQTFDRYWPKDVDLICYVEERTDLPRGRQVDIRSIGECRAFLDRHRHDMVVHGKARRDGQRWKPKEVERGYCYRYDAYKFGRVSFFLRHALTMVPSDSVLVWLDGDVVTFAKPPANWLEQVLPATADVSYLGRMGVHSDIAFQGYRLPKAAPIIHAFAETYASDAFMRLPEWHSAYVWDRCVENRDPSIRAHNITPRGQAHVWTQSPLFDWCDHLKGDKRKVDGRSVQRAS